MAEGKGARLYDWRNVNQVKNVSKVKTGHPCQMPIQVMKSIIGILPDGIGVIDPFLSSGTTAVACAEPGVPFIGYEIVDDYLPDELSAKVCCTECHIFAQRHYIFNGTTDDERPSDVQLTRGAIAQRNENCDGFWKWLLGHE